ncbi:hypothetical protein N0A02_15350 [Paraburkholderia acidicola]|uniref:Transmembrane protein n=1 Tax=Paraburkholderia acidicola TaxID=1912599 RepID=A0ABV1LPB5_9BURK
MFRSIFRLFPFVHAFRHHAGRAAVSRAGTVLRSTTCIAVASAALIACSPTYDWRTVTNDTQGYSIDLPAKPSNDERQIDIGGRPMKMAMQIAEADHTVFAVGTVTLPSDDPQMQRTALEFLRAGLARNLGATPNAHVTQIPLAAGGQVLGIEMTFSGKAGANQESRTMHARLVARGRHVYQAAIIGSKNPAPEQIDQFFQSFKLD